MGISNTIPPSRLIQPGVVANTAARPTSPFTGQAIYQVDTNQMLLWNGTAWVIPNTPAQNPTGLEFISSTTATSGSSITVSNCFSSTYDAYKIIATGGGTAAASAIAFQFTGITTGYYGGVIYFAYAGGGPSAPSAVGFNNASNWQEIGHSNVNGCSLNMDIQNANLAKHKAYGCSTPNVNTAGSLVLSNGICASTTQATGFTLSIGSTFTGITVNVYGYRKS